MKPTIEQAKVKELFLKGNSLKVGAVAGSGKEQPTYCKVQTPNGEVEIGSLVVGDEILSTTGEKSFVDAVYPQGIKPAYRVTFRDGTHTECGLEHLWLINNRGRRCDKEKVLSLSSIMSSGLTKTKGSGKHRIPLTSPVVYSRKELPVDPYLLGTLIGDGYLVGSTPTISFNALDKGMLRGFKDEVEGKLTLSLRNTSENGLQTTLIPKDKVKNHPNKLMKGIREIELNIKSGEKFIPLSYLRGDEQQRKEILRGLMDTDGSCSRNRTSFSSTSLKLIEGVTTLVQSLGGTTIRRKDDVREGKSTCYSLNVKTLFNPFKHSDKKANWRFSKYAPPCRYITSVDYVGEVEQVCISVSAENSLYLTDNYIVTHNTSTLRLLAKSTEKSCLYLAFNKVAATEAGAKMPSNVTCKTTHSMAYAKFGAKYRDKLSRPKGGYRNVAGTVGEIQRYFKVPSLVCAGGIVISRIAKLTVAAFECSSSSKIDESHIPYAEILRVEEKANRSGATFDKPLLVSRSLDLAKKLWLERLDLFSPVLITHDTYLKMYQLSKPKLNFQVIFLDEAQDTTDCVLDIFLAQSDHSQLIAVGDKYQAIYGWRGAVNALEKIVAPETQLTNSFRYGQEVADIATGILNGEVTVKGYDKLDTMVGKVNESKPYTYLFRTNVALIREGVFLISEGVDVKMQADIKGFLRLIESMLALLAGDLKKVKHEDVVIYNSWQELKEEADVSGGDISLMAKLILDPAFDEIMTNLRNYRESPNPQVLITTAHKSKGLEFDQVKLGSDFPDVIDEEGNYIGLSSPERNLLYVASTRAVKVLEVNSTVRDVMENYNSSLQKEKTK